MVSSPLSPSSSSSSSSYFSADSTIPFTPYYILPLHITKLKYLSPSPSSTCRTSTPTPPPPPAPLGPRALPTRSNTYTRASRTSITLDLPRPAPTDILPTPPPGLERALSRANSRASGFEAEVMYESTRSLSKNSGPSRASTTSPDLRPSSVISNVSRASAVSVHSDISRSRLTTAHTYASSRSNVPSGINIPLPDTGDDESQTPHRISKSRAMAELTFPLRTADDFDKSGFPHTQLGRIHKAEQKKYDCRATEEGIELVQDKLLGDILGMLKGLGGGDMALQLMKGMGPGVKEIMRVVETCGKEGTMKEVYKMTEQMDVEAGVEPEMEVKKKKNKGRKAREEMNGKGKNAVLLKEGAVTPKKMEEEEEDDEVTPRPGMVNSETGEVLKAKTRTPVQQPNFEIYPQQDEILTPPVFRPHPEDQKFTPPDPPGAHNPFTRILKRRSGIPKPRNLGSPDPRQHSQKQQDSSTPTPTNPSRGRRGLNTFSFFSDASDAGGPTIVQQQRRSMYNSTHGDSQDQPPVHSHIYQRNSAPTTTGEVSALMGGLNIEIGDNAMIGSVRTRGRSRMPNGERLDGASMRKRPSLQK